MLVLAPSMVQLASMATGVRGYRDLLVWQRAMAVVADVYRLTDAFPPNK